MNSYVAYVFRRVPNSRYTKFGWNRLRGQRVNLEQTNKHTFAFIYKKKKEDYYHHHYHLEVRVAKNSQTALFINRQRNASQKLRAHAGEHTRAQIMCFPA
jgi:hypothetical protein